jgi:hypothetical protein
MLGHAWLQRGRSLFGHAWLQRGRSLFGCAWLQRGCSLFGHAWLQRGRSLFGYAWLQRGRSYFQSLHSHEGKVGRSTATGFLPRGPRGPRFIQERAKTDGIETETFRRNEMRGREGSSQAVSTPKGRVLEAA